MKLIAENRPSDIESLCHRHHVIRLEAFGAANNGEFDPSRCDVGFIVEFESMPAEQHSNAYFGLLFDLEELLNRRVDLVELKAIRNPYFLASVNSSRSLVYAA